jgi:Uma2 family endonuclease
MAFSSLLVVRPRAAPHPVHERSGPESTSGDEKSSVEVDAGVRLVWVVDPRARLAAVHHPGGLVTMLREDGVLDGEDVLPGFRLPLSTAFR